MSLKRAPVSRAATLFIIAVVMLVLGIVLVVSSFLLWVVFPLGFYPSRLLWIEIHKWSGLALTIVVLVHVLLHWKWLWAMTKKYLAGKRSH